MTPVAVMGSKKLPPVANFDNNNEENGFGNMFKGDLKIDFGRLLKCVCCQILIRPF